jgi:acetyl/propionyl-CoA carboxylase alpha subunit
MFKKILIANRGEIATRIIRTCREMGIWSVALYTPTDRDSLHVRLADEAHLLHSPNRYGDADEVLAIAKAAGAEAIHPGYGFLAEEADFAERCAAEGVVFIGPPPAVIRAVRNKMEAMETVKRAGHRVPVYAELPDAFADEAALQRAAAQVGYPLVVKSARGGRGRGARVVMHPDKLAEAVRSARREAQLIYGDDHLYLERAIAPSHYLSVQVLVDVHGNLVHLGEREGSLLRHNQKLIEESPSPALNDAQRRELWAAAVDIARLFNFQNTGAVEFLVDSAGHFFFTEIKARIQIEHGVSEMVSGMDIVREQIRIAAGEPLSRTQEQIRLEGWAMHCRINAEDPWNDYLPSPGRLTRFRLPQGPDVRVDTYGYAGCAIPERFDPLLANLIVKGDDRAMCLSRMRRALMEFRIVGVQTNAPLHKQLIQHPAFVAGAYDTNFMARFRFDVSANTDEETCRDLVAIVAVAYLMRRRLDRPVTPPRFLSGWHRSARRLPSRWT